MMYSIKQNPTFFCQCLNLCNIFEQLKQQKQSLVILVIGMFYLFQLTDLFVRKEFTQKVFSKEEQYFFNFAVNELVWSRSLYFYILFYSGPRPQNHHYALYRMPQIKCLASEFVKEGAERGIYLFFIFKVAAFHCSAHT